MRWQDIPGWFPEENAEALQAILKEHKISQVIEIGSYLGRSTAFFLENVLEVRSVDPFVMWTEGRQNGDAMKHGGEDFYEKFKENIHKMRTTGPRMLSALGVCRMTSQECFEKNPDLVADMVYIDAAHDYESVKGDIDMWDTRAKKIICGDDFDENWPGVVQAVGEKYPHIEIFNNIWVVVK